MLDEVSLVTVGPQSLLDISEQVDSFFQPVLSIMVVEKGNYRAEAGETSMTQLPLEGSTGLGMGKRRREAFPLLGYKNRVIYCI